MSRLFVGILVAILLLAAVAAALALPRWFSPEVLRVALERRLGEITRAPVQIGRVEVALGVGIQLRGEDVQLWPHPDGPALRVEHVAAGIEPLSLLTGKLKLRRMLLRGAELRIVQGHDGRFRAPFGFLDASEPPASPHPEELLKPLIAFENALRFLLARPYLALSLDVEQSRVRWFTGDAEAAPRFSLDIEAGGLRHRRLRGDAVLEMQARLFDSRAPLAEMRWTGLRERGGQLQVGVDFSGLELSALEPYVQALQPQAELAGRSGGTLAFSTPEAGYGRLELELSFDALEAGVLEESPWGPLRADHLDAEASLEISPQNVELETARIASGDLQLEVAGTIERPLRPRSGAGLELRFRDLDIAEVRAFLDWLPHTQADDFETFVAPVESGRLRSFSARGGAVLTDWEEFFAGRRPIVAMGIGAEADFADVVLQVGESDRIEGLGGQVSWSPDRVEVSAARALLNGEPLPGLDLVFEGVSHLLEADPDRRQLKSGALPLSGVGALWEILSGDEAQSEEARIPVAIELRIDHLHHPVFLWPLEGVQVVARSEPDGVQLQVEEGTWAGVPIQGAVDWLFEPEQHARVSLRADAPEPGAAAPVDPRGWARGQFDVAAVDHPRWRQLGARGHFGAATGTLRVADLEIELARPAKTALAGAGGRLRPAGLLFGSGSLDLSLQGAVRFGLSLALEDGDVEALIRQMVPDRDVASGRVDAWCSFEGTLVPGTSPFTDWSGLLEISATDGRIQRSLPPIVAIALASRSLNPFARDSIGFDHAHTLLHFRDGSIATREFSIDGPDLRVEASGEVQLLDETNEIEAEVALFMLRQLDWVGNIPVINLLLFGPDRNLLAAYFRLSGPWSDPESRFVPIKSLAAGPAELVLEGVPMIVQRGVRALGSMMDGDPEAAPAPAPKDPETAPWEETPWGS